MERLLDDVLLYRILSKKGEGQTNLPTKTTLNIMPANLIINGSEELQRGA